MFYSLTGEIIYRDDTSVAINCSGIAFKVTTSFNTLKNLGNIGEKAVVYTYLSVRDDGMELFGFSDENELNYFKMLISVSGVGVKNAISVLSELTTETLAASICAGDIKSLTRAQGIGNKIAQRIILELKDKVSKLIPLEIPSGKTIGRGASGFANKGEEVLSALIALGYSYNEASNAVSSLDLTLSVEDMIKTALRELSRR